MKLTVNNNKIESITNNEISKLTCIIYENINILRMISVIELMSEKDEVSLKQSLEKGMVESILKQSLQSGWIESIEEGLEAVNLYLNLSKENRGLLLENIIFTMGPLDKNLGLNSKLREVNVKETGLQNDFDVVFFSNSIPHESKGIYKLKIYGDIEFHECKKNIVNFIPYDSKCHLKRGVKNKLKYIKKVYDLKSDGKFYIPTFSGEVDAQIEFLEEYEKGTYSFIEILELDEVINLLS